MTGARRLEPRGQLQLCTPGCGPLPSAASSWRCRFRCSNASFRDDATAGLRLSLRVSWRLVPGERLCPSVRRVILTHLKLIPTFKTYGETRVNAVGASPGAGSRAVGVRAPAGLASWGNGASVAPAWSLARPCLWLPMGTPAGLPRAWPGAGSLGGHNADRSRGRTLPVLPLLSRPEVTRLSRAFV